MLRSDILQLSLAFSAELIQWYPGNGTSRLYIHPRPSFMGRYIPTLSPDHIFLHQMFNVFLFFFSFLLTWGMGASIWGGKLRYFSQFPPHFDQSTNMLVIGKYRPLHFGDLSKFKFFETLFDNICLTVWGEKYERLPLQFQHISANAQAIMSHLLTSGKAFLTNYDTLKF